MGFDQISLCKKNSVLLNNCNFYDFFNFARVKYYYEIMDFF